MRALLAFMRGRCRAIRAAATGSVDRLAGNRAAVSMQPRQPIRGLVSREDGRCLATLAGARFGSSRVDLPLMAIV